MLSLRVDHFILMPEYVLEEHKFYERNHFQFHIVRLRAIILHRNEKKREMNNVEEKRIKK